MPKPAKAITTKKLFPSRRHPRAPLAVQDRAGLWLDLFVDLTSTILATKDGLSALQVIEQAEDLANRSLDAFEARWPTADIPGQ